MPKSKTDNDLLAAAFALIAASGWRGFGLAKLARDLDRPLSEIYAELPDRASVLTRLGERLDRAMLEIAPAELAEMSPRERLFELIMRRLDAMAPYRAGLRIMAREACGDPAVFCASAASVSRAIRWLLDAADGPGGGCRALLARKALLLAYMRTYRVWLNDETADRAATLAELDRRLAQLEGLARWFAPRPPSAAAAAQPV
jgi:hypothetical protein